MPRPAYLADVAFFPRIPRPAKISVALTDLRDFVRQPRPHQFVFATLAIGFAFLTMFAVYKTFQGRREYVPPEVIYVKDYAPNRTVKDIRVQQAKDLPGELAAKKLREAEDKAQAAAAKKRQEEFQRLAKKMGIS